MKVSATVYALADIARQVGGQAVTVDWLAEQGQPADLANPTDADRQRFGQAKLVLTRGAGEEWAVAGFDDPLRSAGIIRLDLLKTDDASTPPAGLLWLDPEIAKAIAQRVAERLSVLRPAQSGLFHQQANAFSQQIDAITSTFRPRLARLTGIKIAVFSADFIPLLQRAGLAVVQPVDGLPLQLSAEQQQTFISALRAEAPAAIAVDISTALPVQQELTRQFQIPLVLLDSLGSSAAAGHQTYQSILQFNLQQLTEKIPARRALE